MEYLADLQAAMEKVDEVRQTSKDFSLKNHLQMVADSVTALGWVMIEGSPKPHEHISELFGGAQIFGNKVLKEYRDQYVKGFTLEEMILTVPDPTRPTSSGCKPTTRSSRRSPSTPRSITPQACHGTRTESTQRRPSSKLKKGHHGPLSYRPLLLHLQEAFPHLHLHLRQAHHHHQGSHHYRSRKRQTWALSSAS